MAFITAEELRVRLASMLKVDPLDPSVDASSPWQPILEDSVDAGYLDIISFFAQQGYSKAQTDQWARGREYNIDQSLYWCFVKGAGAHGYDDKWVARLDRRKDWEGQWLVDIDGNVLTPGVAIIGFGRMKITQPDGTGYEGEPFRDWKTGTWRPD